MSHITHADDDFAHVGGLKLFENALADALERLGCGCDPDDASPRGIWFETLWERLALGGPGRREDYRYLSEHGYAAYWAREAAHAEAAWSEPPWAFFVHTEALPKEDRLLFTLGQVRTVLAALERLPAQCGVEQVWTCLAPLSIEAQP